MDPVQEQLAIRIANDAVAIAQRDAQIAVLTAEIVRLKAAATEATPAPEGDED